MDELTRMVLDGAKKLFKHMDGDAILVISDGWEHLEVLETLSNNGKVIVAVPGEVSEELENRAKSVIRLPKVALSRVDQIKLAVITGVADGTIDKKARLVCLAGPSDGRTDLDTQLVLDLAQETEMISTELFGSILDQVDPIVFHATLNLALEFAHEGREGKPIGTIFVLGDSDEVLSMSRQLILNPFQGYTEEQRAIIDPALRETIREFAALDGAFVIRGDGVVLTAGCHLGGGIKGEDLPQGLGSRHAAAAGMTSATKCLSIVISQSTGTVRVFKDGKIVLEIEKRRKA